MTAITCAKCYRRFTPTAEAVQSALEAHQGQKHALLLCPHCGKANKVAVERLRTALRFLPKARPAAEATAASDSHAPETTAGPSDNAPSAADLPPSEP